MQIDIAQQLLRAAPAGVAARALGVSTGTLRQWHLDGKIEASATEGKHRRYNVLAYLERTGGKS